MKKILTIISMCILGLASCTRPYEVHYDFGLDREELRFKATATASYFMVYGEGDWTLTLSKDAPWLTLDKMSGSGMTQVNVRLLENKGVTRDVWVIVRFQDGAQQELIISQDAPDKFYDKAYTVKTTKVDFLKLEGYKRVAAVAKFIPECIGDMQYWVEYSSDEDTDWVQDLQFNYSDISFKVTENASSVDRTAKICWSFPVAHWETPDTLSFEVNQSTILPSVGLKESYILDPASLDSLKIFPKISWDTDIYNFDLSKFSVSEGVTGKYVKSGNYVALIAEPNISAQSRSFNLDWNIFYNEKEVAKCSTELLQENFDFSRCLNDSYKVDPEGVDSLRLFPNINLGLLGSEVDLTNFVASEGVTAKYVKSGNYVALIAEPNATLQSRSFSFEWQVLYKGETSIATTALIQPYFIPSACNLTLDGKYANSYVLSDLDESYYSLDACLVSGARPADDIESASVLWETSEGLITACSYDLYNNKLYIGKAKNAKGNAVIKLMNASGKVRWSYHFWMTNTGSAVPEITVGGHVFLDRNLGALANTAPVDGESDVVGLFYQWGRKDPFPAPQNLKTANGVMTDEVYPKGAVVMAVMQNGVAPTVAIENPSTFYWGNNNVGNEDWSNPQNDEYWKTTEKTDFDPCPYGYVVPDKTQITALIKTDYVSASYGNILTCDDGVTNYLCSCGWMRRKLHDTSQYAHTGQYPHYWSTTPGKVDDDCIGAYVTDKITAIKTDARRWGATIRCVKQTKTE